MTKKNFKSGMDLLLQGSKNKIEEENDNGKMPDYHHHTKATYYFNSETLRSIKAIAYYDRSTIGEVIDKALKQYVDEYEQLESAREEYAQRYPDK